MRKPWGNWNQGLEWCQVWGGEPEDYGSPRVQDRSLGSFWLAAWCASEQTVVQEAGTEQRSQPPCLPLRLSQCSQRWRVSATRDFWTTWGLERLESNRGRGTQWTLTYNCVPLWQMPVFVLLLWSAASVIPHLNLLVAVEVSQKVSPLACSWGWVRWKALPQAGSGLHPSQGGAAPWCMPEAAYPCLLRAVQIAPGHAGWTDSRRAKAAQLRHRGSERPILHPNWNPSSATY